MWRKLLKSPEREQMLLCIAAIQPSLEVWIRVTFSVLLPTQFLKNLLCWQETFWFFCLEKGKVEARVSRAELGELLTFIWLKSIDGKPLRMVKWSHGMDQRWDAWWFMDSDQIYIHSGMCFLCCFRLLSVWNIKHYLLEVQLESWRVGRLREDTPVITAHFIVSLKRDFFLF